MPSSLTSRRWLPLALGIGIPALIAVIIFLLGEDTVFGWMFMMPVVYVVAGLSDIGVLSAALDSNSGMGIGAFLAYAVVLTPVMYGIFSTNKKVRKFSYIIFYCLLIYFVLAAWTGMNIALEFMNSRGLF